MDFEGLINETKHVRPAPAITKMHAVPKDFEISQERWLTPETIEQLARSQTDPRIAKYGTANLLGFQRYARATRVRNETARNVVSKT